MPDQAPTKSCRLCLEIKNLEDFYLKGVNKHRNACKKCIQKQANESKLKLFGSFRSCNLFRNYGITANDYDQMFEGQQGRCAICKRERVLVVDHDHNTGIVRGLLCNGCNTGLGQFENLNLFDTAKEYVNA